VKGPLEVAVITGLSGSGKSTAIHALEDLDYYCIDNLPAVLIPRFMDLCEGSEEISRVALGVDSRARTFLEELPRALDDVRRRGHRVDVTYLDAADETLMRRFNETRRPHPLADGSDLAAGIRRERGILAALREQADRIIDTTALTTHQLRDAVRSLFFAKGMTTGLRVVLLSFGFKYGLPSDADLVWDARFLPNPFWIEELRPKTGLDAAVVEHVLASPAATRFIEIVGDYLRFSLPFYEREGKTYLTLAIGCTGGRHRSVVLVERLAAVLEGEPVAVAIRHRDVER
jgi:RNase adapter protein RapZ